MKKRASIIISGKVQGVFYRMNTKNKAKEFGLTGWVKNTPDGEVKILAEGEEKNLKELIKWCYNGSEEAKVNKVEVEWKDVDKKEFEMFEITH